MKWAYFKNWDYVVLVFTLLFCVVVSTWNDHDLSWEQMIIQVLMNMHKNIEIDCKVPTGITNLN